MKRFDFHTPHRLEEAVALLEEFEGDGVRILAGGTDLLVMMKHESVCAQHLVNIKGIPGLGEIRRDGEGFVVGAIATLSKVAEHAEIRDGCPTLVQAIGTIASPQIRNRGTIGGNICLETKCLFLNRHIEARRSRPECLKEGGKVCSIVKGAKRCFSLFSADSVPVLIVLKAKLRVFGASGNRVVPIEQIYSGDGAKPFNLNNEIVTHVLIPSPIRYCVYLKERWRGSVDFPIVGVAMAITLDSNGKRCEDVRIALTGVSGFPVRAEGAESVFKGNDISVLRDKERLADSAKQALKASHPISSMGGLREYRRSQVNVLVERAAGCLADRIEKRGR